MRALVVDDSKPSRSILARVLRDLRFDCTEAANGLEALATLSTSPRPDLVTINWHMPVMDGIELLKRLRAAPAHRDLKLLMVVLGDYTLPFVQPLCDLLSGGDAPAGTSDMTIPA